MRAMPFQWIDLYIDKYLDITSERYESQAFSMEGPVQKIHRDSVRSLLKPGLFNGGTCI